MTDSSSFSANYCAARDRFCAAADAAHWRLERHAIGERGPAGEELSIDVAMSPEGESDQLLIVSSGLHGVEGLLGSAAQLAWLARWPQAAAPSIRYLFLHALNPYGMAHARRADVGNVDANRNFLLPGEAYAGSPPGYAELDRLLNPRTPPSRWEPFLAKALWKIFRVGMPALRQAIAAGQYDFPQGMFFGGNHPLPLVGLLRERLADWIAGARQTVHLDFHTGLGASGECKLLIDTPLDEQQHARLTQWFGPDSFETMDATEIAYSARGGLGQWCVATQPQTDYLFACAEYGTYAPLRVLTALRAENQAHHWGQPGSPATAWAKRRLQEAFCPANPTWRARVLEHSQRLIQQAAEGLGGG